MCNFVGEFVVDGRRNYQWYTMCLGTGARCWGRVQDAVETLIKEREEQKDGKGKEVVDEEGVSSVRTEGSGSRGSGNGGSRPGFWGRIPKLSTVVSTQDFKVRVKVVGDTNRSLALNPGRPYVGI